MVDGNQGTNEIMKETEYMEKAKNASLKSTCRKKHLGCVLKFPDDSYVQGTNGPPSKLPLCNPCPRLNDHGATNLHKCRAVHAERQVLLKAAKLGYSTDGAILYSYMGVPCKDCLLELLEAGIAEIVCIRETYNDELSKTILKEWVNNGGKFRIL